MATRNVGTVLHCLRGSLIRQDETGLTDGDLLGSFIAGRDEASFEALVRRHGPMVLGVCRRVLRNEADAEDAFQDTFLVLVRKAASIRPQGRVGNWLYGVAHSTALKARAMSTRRLAKERQAASSSRAVATADTRHELEALLDQELKALPDIYRAAIVLCDLEGKSIKEAARHLARPLGTIGARLARGRRLLARRLSRHGLALSPGVIATVIAQNAAAADVPPLLLSSTVKTAALVATGQVTTSALASAKVAALTEGVLKAMALSKLKTAATALLTLALLAGAGGLLRFHKLAAQQAQGKQEDPRPTATRVAGTSNDDRGKPDSDRADPAAFNPVPELVAAAQPPNKLADPPLVVPFREGPGIVAAPRPVADPEQQLQKLEQLEQRLRKMEDNMKRLEEKLDRVLKALEQNSKPD